jgi:hypothetical protein
MLRVTSSFLSLQPWLLEYFCVGVEKDGTPLS